MDTEIKGTHVFFNTCVPFNLSPPGQRGGEGQILRSVFFQSIALAILVDLLGLLQAYVLMRWVPRLRGRTYFLIRASPLNRL
jgi:uncharacterized membrane protein